MTNDFFLIDLALCLIITRSTTESGEMFSISFDSTASSVFEIIIFVLVMREWTKNESFSFQHSVATFDDLVTESWKT